MDVSLCPALPPGRYGTTGRPRFDTGAGSETNRQLGPWVLYGFACQQPGAPPTA